MRQTYEDYLFSRGYLVSSPLLESSERHPAEALMALANYAEIQITQNPQLADIRMLQVAQRNLGIHVPQPFYFGFPKTVLGLSRDQLLLDQLIHYFITYGLGDFSHAGHSLFEQFYERAAFAEDVQPKLFAIITEQEAQDILARGIEGLLASTRPLNQANYDLLLEYLRDRNPQVNACPCKDTVCRLIIDTGDVKYADLMALPDVIRLVEWLLELRYIDIMPSKRAACKQIPSKPSLSKLNLKNRHRKLISAVLDRLFERGDCDVSTCLEKKRVWNGLLHHIHYQPKCAQAIDFCDAVRGKQARSAYSEFQLLMDAREVRAAAQALRVSKGSATVLRNLAYLLSRCKSSEEVEAVLAAAESDNKIVLMQLLVHFYTDNRVGPRFFKFVHLDKIYRHLETTQEMARRRSRIGGGIRLQTLLFLEDALRRACHGKLGKVYADEAMRNIALPLQEAASQGGFGTLPRGSRLPIPRGKKVRAFVYWEKVDDIDLSCFAMNDLGETDEFSWRTMAGAQDDALTFSGDVTSGFKGGSEYFDVNLQYFREVYPLAHCLIFCANVFTEDRTFASCTCRAGYMLRDEEDSGEVYEPKTVESAFTINCASSVAHLFAIDLKDNAFVWLNLAENSNRQIAGTGNLSFLMDYLHVADAMNLHDFACMLATEVVDSPQEADVVFSDAQLALRDDQEQVRSFDTARILQLMN